MPVSLSIEPSSFVVPTGPAIVFVKVDRDAFHHLDPDTNPLTDADSPSAVMRKGADAVDYVRRELSNMLFGADVPCSEIQHVYPHPDFFVTLDSEPLLQAKYVGFYWHWKREVLAREPFPALVELISESTPVDNCLRFNAFEVADEERNGGFLESIFRAEATRAKMRAEHAQASVGQAALP